MKKCLEIAKKVTDTGGKGTDETDGYVMSQMIIGILGSMRVTDLEDKDREFCDKRDPIIALNFLIKHLLSYFIKSILSRKGQLNQNEY